MQSILSYGSPSSHYSTLSNILHYSNQTETTVLQPTVTRPFQTSNNKDAEPDDDKSEKHMTNSK